MTKQADTEIEDPGNFCLKLIDGSTEIEATFSSYSIAMAEALRLARVHPEGKINLFETGEFRLNRKLNNDWVLLWWHGLEDHGEPKGRGHGYFITDDDDEVDTPVKYKPCEPDDDAEADETEDEHEDEQTYASVVCDSCGLILPQNEAYPDEIEEETGRTSGGKRKSSSRSTRRGARGMSFGNTYGESTYTPRIQTRIRKIFLCEDCYQEKYDEHEETAEPYYLVKWVLFLVVAAGAFWLAAKIFYSMFLARIS